MMTKLLYTLLTLSLAFGAFGQSVTITDTTTTPSICFNDGTIHVAASGGTGSYSFSIISGPSYPNITYPINLPGLATSFVTLPKGTYTIKVTDAGGGVSFATATVGGTYTFPTLSTSVTSNYCIQATVLGGRGPFHYAISSVSSNAGFGTYQNSNIFCVCTGHYWVRVMDSCSNIFTTIQIDLNIPTPQIILNVSTSGPMDTIFSTLSVGSGPPYTYQLNNGGAPITNTTGVFVVPKSCKPDTVTLTDRCGTKTVTIINPHPLNVNGLNNCTAGSAILTIGNEALGPFTITGMGTNQTTHSFNVSVNGLPPNTTYNFTVTDSCGNTQNVSLPCSTIDTTFFEDVCPFDSMLHFKQNQLQYCFPVILTCLNCSPLQHDTIYSVPHPVFHNIDTGFMYSIRIQDACGFDFTTTYTTFYGPLVIMDSLLTCNDFMAMSKPPVFVPPVHYTLFSGSTQISSIDANRPIFYHNPADSYLVTGTHDLCREGRVYVTLPALGGRCAVPMMDSSCTPSYAIFQPYMPSVETFTLVNTATGSIYSEKSPRPTGTPILFANVPVGNYNLVSDSGCAIPYVLAPYHYEVTATSRRECNGVATIIATVNPPISSCNTAQGQYFTLLKDNQYLSHNTDGVFTVPDTGNYVIRVFLSNTTIFNFPATYDTICPLDTFLLNVQINPTPNVVSVQQEVCGNNTANVPYTILGGTPPYTVQITGYPTRTVTSVNDTFPNVLPGIYTMIVADNCGISRSFSVAVIDTCSSNCVTQSHFTLSDTLHCRDARVGMTNQSIGATHYKWTVNGSTYAYKMDTSFVTNTPGIYTVTLYAYIGTCVDSSTQRFVVEDTLRSSGISDTFLCQPFTLQLNTHNPHSTWSNGINDSVSVFSMAGTYWVQVSNTCGSVRDSFDVSAKLSPLFTLMASDSSLCADQRDSSVLSAALIDSSGTRVVFTWSTGHVDNAVYSSQIIIYQGDTTYHVMVADSFCPVGKDIYIAKLSCDSLCYAHIGIPDAFSPNGDGKNDTFHLLHFCQFEPFTMHIFNRWGELVFTSHDIDKGWDGKYKGEPQPDGVFWWHVALAIDGRSPRELAGKLTLLR